MRKRNRVILAVTGFIVFFFCIEGWGADWKFIGRDVEDSTWEIDVTNISRQTNIVRIWVKHTYSPKASNRTVKQFGSQYTNVSDTKYLNEFNCTENKVRVLSCTFYSLGGGVIGPDNSVSELTSW